MTKYFPIGLISLLVIWWLSAWCVDNPFILPTPKSAFQVIKENIGYYFLISSRTLLFASGGLAVSALIALLVGILATGWKIFEFIYPMLVAIKATPAVVFAPILAVIIGSGVTVKVAVAALISLFPIVVTTIEGARLTPRDLETLGIVYGASRWRTIWKIEIVYLVNGWLTGIQSAAPLAIIGAIVAEFVDPSDVNKGGIGLDIAIKKTSFSIPQLYASSFCAILIGILSFGMMFFITRYFQKKFEIIK